MEARANLEVRRIGGGLGVVLLAGGIDRGLCEGSVLRVVPESDCIGFSLLVDGEFAAPMAIGRDVMQRHLATLRELAQ